MLQNLRRYFISGLLVTAPISITIYIVLSVAAYFDQLLLNLLPKAYHAQVKFIFTIPGVGMLIGILCLIAIGWIAVGALGRIFLTIGDHLINRMPVIRTIYGGLKQIFEALLLRDTKAFEDVCLVEYPRKGVWSIGFSTGMSRGQVQELTGKEVLNIFVPTTPNPTSGFLLFLPKEDVVITTLTVEEGIKLVVSAGMIVPK